MIRKYIHQILHTGSSPDIPAEQKKRILITSSFSLAGLAFLLAFGQQRLLCLLVADINYFKRVNGTYGHEIGDQVLAVVGQTLDRNNKKQDIVCRWAGEELFVFLPETDIDQESTVAERLRRAIELLEFPVNEAIIRVTISIGVAQYRPNQSRTEVIQAADDLLYQAKRAGRKRVF